MRAHNTPKTEQRFLGALLLTSLIFLAELVGGWWTGSLALLSDAAHVFLDVFALGLSYGALRLSALPADDRHTFGYHRLEVLAALINGLTLGLISFGIFREAWERWQAPPDVKSTEMLVIAAVGLIVNLIVALVLQRDEHIGHSHTVHDHGHSHAIYDHEHDDCDDTLTPPRDLNMHSAYLHVVGDAISSVGVIMAGLVIGATGWMWVDPLMSVVIGIIILASSARVLRSSLHILVEGTPEGLSLEDVAHTITSTPGILEVHDLHVWNLCSGHIALSAHAVLQEQLQHDSGLILMELQRRLKRAHGIEHITVQLEKPATASERLIAVK